MGAARSKVARAPWLHRRWCSFCLHRCLQDLWEGSKETKQRRERSAAYKAHFKRLHHRRYCFSLCLGCLVPWGFWRDEGPGARLFLLRLNIALPRLREEMYHTAGIKLAFIVYEGIHERRSRSWEWIIENAELGGPLQWLEESQWRSVIFVYWFLGPGPTLRAMGSWRSWEDLVDVIERKCAK